MFGVGRVRRPRIKFCIHHGMFMGHQGGPVAYSVGLHESSGTRDWGGDDYLGILKYGETP